MYDTVIMPDSVYKSICIASDTTVRDVIGIVLACCNSSLAKDRLCLVRDMTTTRRVLDSGGGGHQADTVQAGGGVQT